MENSHDLSFLELKDDFEIVDPNSLEIGEEVDSSPGLDLSLEEIGMLEVPLVSGTTVLEGKKRVWSYRKKGQQSILIRRVPQHLTVIAPLHARLVRQPRTVIAVAEDVALWKAQYELEFPQTKKGGNTKAKTQTGIIPFWKMFAKYTGWSQSKIEHLVKIGSMPAEDRVEIHKNEHLANDHVKLLGVARFEPEQKVSRQSVIEGIAAHPKWNLQRVIKAARQDSNKKQPPSDALLDGIPQLHCGDFEEVMMKMPEKSAHLVLTDPLWFPEWFVNLPRLTEQMKRALTDDGVAAIYYSSSNINRVFRAFDDVFGSDKFVTQVIDDQGDGTPQPYNPLGIQDKYKSAVIYRKGKLKLDGTKKTMNIFRSKGLANKTFHEYGQNPETMAHIIQMFTEVGDTVLDCCVGGGATMIAALNTKRNFIGIDIEQSAIAACQNAYAEWKAKKEKKLDIMPALSTLVGTEVTE